MIGEFHLSLMQVILYAGGWIGLDAIKAVCGHEVNWKPVTFVTFFSAGLVAVSFFSLWKPFLP